MSSVFRTVLVPVEFESLPPGETTAGDAIEVSDGDLVAIGVHTVEALELAARLAQGGTLLLVHAHHDFAGYATWSAPDAMLELNAGARKRAAIVLDAAGSRHCAGVALRSIIEPGAPLAVIMAAAEAHTPDAIVLAASSRGRLNRVFNGSTANKLIRSAGCPVVVVPSGTA